MKKCFETAGGEKRKEKKTKTCGGTGDTVAQYFLSSI